jgi:hypothetical protein
MASGRGYGLVYIGGTINSEPSDQTDLKQRHRCDLQGSGKPSFEREIDPWVPQVDRLVGGAGRPHMLAFRHGSR